MIVILHEQGWNMNLPGLKRVLLVAFLLSAFAAKLSAAQVRRGREVLPGIMVLTGHDLRPFQTSFELPELADPYVTLFKDAVLISGTAQYSLKLKSVEDISRGGPYQIVWNEFLYPDGTPMADNRFAAPSWDMKPVLWASLKDAPPRIWDPAKDTAPPQIIWYGGHMRPGPGKTAAHWPADNYSRDIFAFLEKLPGKWFSMAESLFPARGTWPRATGNYLGHRYGHQIVNVRGVPTVFYEEVTDVRGDGSPAVTKIFMDEMANPLQARGQPVELVSPTDAASGRTFPSAVREDRSALVEGPLYFSFEFEGEEWEAIGFSAGSFYGRYASCFASRKVSDGRLGKPYQLDLTDDGSDLHDAGELLRPALNLAGGPGRPAVIVGPDGKTILDARGKLQLLVHGYRRDILPDLDYVGFPTKYRLDQMFRVMIHATLDVRKGRNGALRFQIAVPRGRKPDWTRRRRTRTL